MRILKILTLTVVLSVLSQHGVLCEEQNSNDMVFLKDNDVDVEQFNHVDEVFGKEEFILYLLNSLFYSLCIFKKMWVMFLYPQKNGE